MELFVHQVLNTNAEGIGRCCRPNHFLLVAHDDIGTLNTHARERSQITGQQSLPADLNEAFGSMLRDLPETFADSGGQNDGFHQGLPSSSKASRNSTNCTSVSAPMLAMRNTLFSRFPWPA